MVDVQRVKYYFTVDTVRAGTPESGLNSDDDVLIASPRSRAPRASYEHLRPGSRENVPAQALPPLRRNGRLRRCLSGNVSRGFGALRGYALLCNPTSRPINASSWQACIRKKLQLLMFPFLPSINWQRVSKEGKTLPPKDDPIAPDLYIPVMAFLTYVLTIGLALGTSGK